METKTGKLELVEKCEDKTDVAQFEWANSLLYGAILFVVIGMALSYGADIQSDVQTDQTAGSLAYNISGRAMETTDEFSKGSKKAVKIGIGVLLIGAIMGIMYFFNRSKQ